MPFAKVPVKTGMNGKSRLWALAVEPRLYNGKTFSTFSLARYYLWTNI
jgi:hypothetical protein